MAKPIIDVNIEIHRKTDLLIDLHKKFLFKLSERDDPTLDFLKMSGIYWSLTAVDLINSIDLFPRENLINFVLSCYQSDGGFSPAINHDSHLLYTLSALQILTIYESIDKIDKDKTFNYIMSLKNSDGSFNGDKWGEIDTRFSFTAVASIALLGKLDPFDNIDENKEKINQLTREDMEPIVDFVMSCYNYDGGFGSRPHSESHAGQVYCCIGTLSLLGQLRRINTDLTCWWLAERQLPSGGLNGRPEKKPDVCYSWWVLSSLAILGRLSWINSEGLVDFILSSQDDETGGISDRPGDMPDPFHTLFGLAGLSLLQHNKPVEKKVSPETAEKSDILNGQGDVVDSEWVGIEEKSDPIAVTNVLNNHNSNATTNNDALYTSLKNINPVFCMPQYIIDKLELKIETL